MLNEIKIKDCRNSPCRSRALITTEFETVNMTQSSKTGLHICFWLYSPLIFAANFLEAAFQIIVQCALWGCNQFAHPWCKECLSRFGLQCLI